MRYFILLFALFIVLFSAFSTAKLSHKVDTIVFNSETKKTLNFDLKYITLSGYTYPSAEIEQLVNITLTNNPTLEIYEVHAFIILSIDHKNGQINRQQLARTSRDFSNGKLTEAMKALTGQKFTFNLP